MAKEHHYQLALSWQGNRGVGTKDYRAYDRDYQIEIRAKPVLLGSSDPAFLGDPNRHNPEDFLLSAVSSCHMLWYLHFCADHGLILQDYQDQAELTLKSGGGRATGYKGDYFESLILRPTCIFAKEADLDLAERLHAEAHACCVMAQSLKIPVQIEPVLRHEDEQA